MVPAVSTLSDPRFSNETAARAWFEAARWPHGPGCPHCGSLKHYQTKKEGRYRCGEKECRKDYTVTTKSVMGSSHAPLTHWAQAFYLMNSSKKGFSALQLQRALGCQYKTAWFMHHRVMEAMRQGGLDRPPMGGGGQIVEADETYFGNVKIPRPRRADLPPAVKGGRVGPAGKRAIVTLVERRGLVRSFHVSRADKATVSKIVRENIHHESRLHTDESPLYRGSEERFSSHKTVKHSAK
jgi:transposase-like protein